MHSTLIPCPRSISWLAVLLLSGLLVGCDRAHDAAPAESDPEALALVDELNVGTFRAAFDALQDVPHTVSFDVSATRGDDAPFTSSIQRRRPAGSNQYETIGADTTGQVSSSIFAAFHRDSDPLDIASIPDLILEEDPSFLDPLNRSSFIYSLAPDTMLFGRPFSVMTIDRVPGEDRGKPYESIKLLLDERTLVGIEILVDERTVFFGDRSERKVVLEDESSGQWLPHEIEIRSSIKNLFSATQRIEAAWTIQPEPSN